MTISVIMSVYKEPLKYVEKAIDSILAQTMGDFEFLIVDDAPDNPALAEYLRMRASGDARIQILVNERNMGLARSLNRAIEASRGTYLARMDADDMAGRTRFQEELAYLCREDLDMVSCAVDLIDEDDRVWGEIRPFSTDPAEIRQMLRYQNIVVHPTVLMRAEKVRALGGYRNFASCQDYDLWLRFVTAGYTMGALDQKLFSFRRHKDSISASRRYSQILNEQFIRQLYQERVSRQGNDDFSEERLEQFLVSKGFRDEAKFQKENSSLCLYTQGIQLLKKKQLLKGIQSVAAALPSKAVRYTVGRSIRAKMKKKAIIRRRNTGCA